MPRARSSGNAVRGRGTNNSIINLHLTIIVSRYGVSTTSPTAAKATTNGPAHEGMRGLFFINRSCGDFAGPRRTLSAQISAPTRRPVRPFCGGRLCQATNAAIARAGDVLFSLHWRTVFVPAARRGELLRSAVADAEIAEAAFGRPVLQRIVDPALWSN
jgi:hypothetical protein